MLVFCAANDSGTDLHAEDSNKYRYFNGIFIITHLFVLLSVLDVVAGGLITIVRTDDDEFYFFGWYEGQPIFNATQLVGGLYPMDLMAKGLNGQATFQAVSLGCK